FVPVALFASRKPRYHPSYYWMFASSKGLWTIVCSLSLADRVTDINNPLSGIFPGADYFNSESPETG
ncbi:MAG TPA: hypothetical protein VHA30_01130, partial [Patescibacteria group bacterium]|nr:hypothetical protein [Patescibacteria group bacterium]